MCVGWTHRSHYLNRQGRASPRPVTDRGQAILPAPLMYTVDQRSGDACPRRTNRVAEVNGAAMDIQLIEEHVEHPVEQDVVDRERLVVFCEVEVAYREPGFVQNLLDSRDRSLG